MSIRKVRPMQSKQAKRRQPIKQKPLPKVISIAATQESTWKFLETIFSHAFMLTGFALTMRYEHWLAQSLEFQGFQKPCFQIIAALLLAILLWESVLLGRLK